MEKTISTIVFPTDFSSESVTALPLALDLAKKYNAEIHCINAVEVPHMYTTLDMGAIAVPSAEQLADGSKERMNTFAHEHLTNTPNRCHTEVMMGHAATVIVDYAKQVAPAMIVMTTHGYSGVRHVILGSTTEDVLRHADCPVVSVRVGKKS